MELSSVKTHTVRIYNSYSTKLIWICQIRLLGHFYSCNTRFYSAKTFTKSVKPDGYWPAIFLNYNIDNLALTSHGDDDENISISKITQHWITNKKPK